MPSPRGTRLPRRAILPRSSACLEAIGVEEHAEGGGKVGRHVWAFALLKAVDLLRQLLLECYQIQARCECDEPLEDVIGHGADNLVRSDN